MPSVLQPWVEEIPMRMQSTLLLGLRGPDTHVCPGVKKIQRWMRGLVFRPGNPDNVKEFMSDAPDPEILEKSPLAKELEFCSQHFYSHLMHALEVIAYRYHNAPEAFIAFGLYKSMCFLMHLHYEGRWGFEARLREMKWPGGKIPVDYYKDAVSMLDGEGQ